MTHILIEDNTPEGRFLLDLIKNHKSVTVINEEAPSFRQAAQACNAVPVSVFAAELRKQISDEFRKDA